MFVAYRKETWGLLTRLSKLKAKEHTAATLEAQRLYPKEAKDGTLLVKKPENKV